MKKRKGKLSLAKETLVSLSSIGLRDAVGGQKPAPTLYDPSCESCAATCPSLCILWSCACTSAVE